MVKYQFIEEIKESRMFRGVAGLRGQRAYELGRVLYVAMLSLELIRQHDQRLSSMYAYRTLQYNDFDKMRNGTTDVANLVCVLSNQSDYAERIEVNFDVHAPTLQLQSYMQRLRMGLASPSLDRQFFINLEYALGISDSTLSGIRRVVLGWQHGNRWEKQAAVSNLRRELQRHAMLLDITELLPNELNF